MNGTELIDDDLDNSNSLGFSVVLPAIPFNGNYAAKACKIVDDVSQNGDQNNRSRQIINDCRENESKNREDPKKFHLGIRPYETFVVFRFIALLERVKF